MILVVILLALLAWLVAKLVKMMKQTPDEHQMFKSSKSVQEIADEIKRIAAEVGADIEKIQSDPLGNYGSSSDIAVVLHGKGRGMLGGLWGVQVYVDDNDGNGSDVELVALGQQGSSMYSWVNIDESRAKCEFIAGRLT